MTDPARACAEELNKRAIINGSDIGVTAACIRQHFPPSSSEEKAPGGAAVPVEKLKGCSFMKINGRPHYDDDAITALIAEAEK